MSSAVRAESFFSKSAPLSTASTRLRQSSSRAEANSAASRSVAGAVVSDITAESRDRACHLFDQVFAGDLLGIGKGFAAKRFDLVHIETGRLQLADRNGRTTHQPAAQHAE